MGRYSTFPHGSPTFRRDKALVMKADADAKHFEQENAKAVTLKLPEDANSILKECNIADLTMRSIEESVIRPL